MDLLGWEVAMEGKKRKPVLARFMSLGATVDLGHLKAGRVM